MGKAPARPAGPVPPHPPDAAAGQASRPGQGIVAGRPVQYTRALAHRRTDPEP